MTAAAAQRHQLGGEDHRWWSTYTSWVGRQRGDINTCVPQGSCSRMVSSRSVLRRVIRRADTGGHTQQPLITVGDSTIIEHFVK